MSKKVFFVEDYIHTLDGMLDSVQAIILKAGATGVMPVSNQEKIQFFVLQIVNYDRNDEQIRADQDSFCKIEYRAKQQRKQLQESKRVSAERIPEIEYKYEVIDLSGTSSGDFPQDCKTFAEKIQERIDCLLEDCTEYSVMLDLILLGRAELEMDLQKYKIASQYLYENYSDHCIPYTHYGQSKSLFRTEWKKAVGMTEDIMERLSLKGNKIYIPLRKKIYKQLNIGDE